MVFFAWPNCACQRYGSKTFDKKQIKNGSGTGGWMTADVDIHSLSILESDNGSISSMTITFDIWHIHTARFEIYGTEGTICISDPDPVHGAK